MSGNITIRWYTDECEICAHRDVHHVDGLLGDSVPVCCACAVMDTRGRGRRRRERLPWWRRSRVVSAIDPEHEFVPPPAARRAAS